jgi:hypothetical protein
VADDNDNSLEKTHSNKYVRNVATDDSPVVTADARYSRCIHLNRWGARCKNPPLLGATVCTQHGGNAEHIRRAAAERLTMALPEAVEALTARLKDDPNAAPCALCKRGLPRDDHVVVKVATAIMDRGGLGPQSKVEIQHADTAWMRYLSDTELDTLISLMESAKSRMPENDRPAEEDEPSVH